MPIRSALRGCAGEGRCPLHPTWRRSSQGVLPHRPQRSAQEPTSRAGCHARREAGEVDKAVVATSPM
eukprot:4818500-Alexandrium_andersonii.AAC.1